LVKIIHQTWVDENIPHNIYKKEWQDSWKNMNPDWNYMFWTDEDNERLIRDDYPSFWETFQKVEKGVVKSDLCRILYLHKYGGIYADMDFICLRDITLLLSVLDSHIVLGKHNNPRQPLPNAWMYSPKGDLFWLDMARDSFDDLRNNVTRSIEQTAGPDRLNWAVETHRPNHTELAHNLIYPRAWGIEECDKHASTVDWTNIQDVRRAYPDSFAVTPWSHNW
jgi:mannosyltransferase OCH1-like enzyme